MFPKSTERLAGALTIIGAAVVVGGGTYGFGMLFYWIGMRLVEFFGGP